MAILDWLSENSEFLIFAAVVISFLSGFVLGRSDRVRKRDEIFRKGYKVGYKNGKWAQGIDANREARWQG